MATVNKQSLREEFDALKGEFERLCASGKMAADSLGAGDVFNAGIIDALLRKSSPEQSLHHAVRLAAAKCTRPGLVI